MGGAIDAEMNERAEAVVNAQVNLIYTVDADGLQPDVLQARADQLIRETEFEWNGEWVRRHIKSNLMWVPRWRVFSCKVCISALTPVHAVHESADRAGK